MIDDIDSKIADASASIWISASAGTGKTKNLIDRILALLFHGVRPERILCLTYTKAAAHEMLGRLAQKIMQLHEQPFEKSEKFPLLTKQFIDELYEKSLSASWVAIQTIHSFSMSVLKQAAVETGLYPHAELCDDATKDALINEAIADVMNDKKHYSDLRTVMSNTSDFTAVFKENFSDISHFLSTAPQVEKLYTEMLQVNPKFLRMNKDEAVKALFSEIFGGREREIFRSLAEKLQKSTKNTDLKNSDFLFRQADAPDENFTDAFLTNGEEIRKTLCTNEVKDSVLADMEENAQRARDFVQKLNDIRTAQGNVAFFRASQAIIRKFQTKKAQRHCIDYDDVIDLAINLLHNFEWIMYKIDSQIEHVLVDEAQDTSPEQWEIVKLITQEFFTNYQSGKTVFVVGDEKQSIFSFQGANVEYFHEVHDYFKQAAEVSGAKFYDIMLTKSYRTAGKILDFADNVFKNIFPNVHHETARDPHAGQVKIVPLIAAAEDDDNPMKSVSQLAEQIADTIDNILKNKVFVPSKNRAAQPSDFMILFKKRDLSTYMIRRELKKRRIPVAEADRIKLNDELAVEDLTCLAKFALLPADDLMCARVLKSAAVGISEDELMELCLNRKEQNLWTFVKQSELYEKYGLRKLQKYIDEYTMLPPYLFFAKVLDDGVYEKIVGRLGNICVNSINEFLNLTRKYSESNSGILQNFLNWFDSADIDLKRDISNQNNEVQLITVHGSKGLQAPYIILANANAQSKNDMPIVKRCESAAENYYQLLWKPYGKTHAKCVQEAIDAQKRRNRDESNRLLYVALTRAEDFLYVFGLESKRKNAETWYGMLNEKFVPEEYENEEIFSIDCGEKAEIAPDAAEHVPDWFYQPLQLPSYECESDSIEITYGNFVHELLSFSKEDIDDEKYFAAIIEKLSKKYCLPDGMQQNAVEEARGVFQNFPKIFSANSRSEVEILFHGQLLRIDKIFLDNNQLWIIDFKTGKPHHSSKYEHQLQTYREAVQGAHMYNDCTIRTALLWTKSKKLQEYSL